MQIGECDNLVVIRPNYGDPSRKTMVPNGVLTEDSGVGTNSLYTGPEFGCIHFDRNCGPIGTYYSSVIDSQDWNTIIIKNVTGDEVMWLHSRDPATNGLMSKGDLLSCYREITSEEFETLRESWKNLK